MNAYILPEATPSVLHEEPVLAKSQRSDAAPHYPVDPATPEFTHLLMKCFTEARNEAIGEYEKLVATGVVETDQQG